MNPAAQTMPSQENVLGQLYDIEGLDAVSWWPPASGWWVVLAVFVLVLIGILMIRQRKTRVDHSWRKIVLAQLDAMASVPPSHAVAAELSELIRRITIHQYSRSECAGLEGEAWLEWLSEHDPKGFDWRKQGAWITQIPYAPENTDVEQAQIFPVLNAIRGWIE